MAEPRPELPPEQVNLRPTENARAPATAVVPDDGQGDDMGQLGWAAMDVHSDLDLDGEGLASAGAEGQSGGPDGADRPDADGANRPRPPELGAPRAEAIQLLVAGEQTAAEGLVLAHHMERGRELEDEGMAARESFMQAGAARAAACEPNP